MRRRSLHVQKLVPDSLIAVEVVTVSSTKCKILQMVCLLPSIRFLIIFAILSRRFHRCCFMLMFQVLRCCDEF